MELASIHDEQLVVWANRFEEACEAGLTEEDAQEFADSDRDVGELRALVRRGCPPKLIAEIVL